MLPLMVALQNISFNSISAVPKMLAAITLQTALGVKTMSSLSESLTVEKLIRLGTFGW
jgi:hypothetical protein